jgi:hypothetical protein
LAALGGNRRRHEPAWHFCSWQGLSPGSKIGGGKVISRLARKVKSRAAWAFRMAAALRRSKSSLGEFFRKMRSRQGPRKAIAAMAQKLARLVRCLQKNGEEYAAKTMAEMEEKRERRAMAKVIAQASKPGFKLVPYCLAAMAGLPGHGGGNPAPLAEDSV